MVSKLFRDLPLVAGTLLTLFFAVVCGLSLLLWIGSYAGSEHLVWTVGTTRCDITTANGELRLFRRFEWFRAYELTWIRSDHERFAPTEKWPGMQIASQWRWSGIERSAGRYKSSAAFVPEGTVLPSGEVIHKESFIWFTNDFSLIRIRLWHVSLASFTLALLLLHWVVSIFRTSEEAIDVTIDTSLNPVTAALNAGGVAR